MVSPSVVVTASPSARECMNYEPRIIDFPPSTHIHIFLNNTMAGNTRGSLQKDQRITSLATQIHSAMLGVPDPFTDPHNNASQDDEQDDASSQHAQRDDSSADEEDLETETEVLQAQYDRMRESADKRTRTLDEINKQIESSKAVRGV